MTNTEIKVKRSRKAKSNSTEKQMMVESNTDSSYDVFNGQIIVDSLKRELELSEEDAISIAKKVEGNLLKSNFKTVTSSYIRSLVNQFLTDLGYDKWLKYSSLSIPLYDVKQLIEEHNTENSNTAFSPESINLTVAGQILKQYALREVFNPIVADAHLKGEIHCHDLDFVNRPYAFDGENSYVCVRYKPTQKETKMTIKDCFNLLTALKEIKEKDATIKEFSDYEILDKEKWTDLIKIVEILESKEIYEIELESGDKIYVTEEHPCLKYQNETEHTEVRADELRIGDMMYVK